MTVQLLFLSSRLDFDLSVCLFSPMDTPYVSFSADVFPKSAEALIATFSQFCNQGIQEAHLMLNTPGGAVMLGLQVYNTLRALPIKITTYNMGNVDSIGNVVFLAGDERYACPTATFMFHGVGFDINGQIRLEEAFLREKLDSVVADHRRIGSIFQEHTSLDEAQVLDLFAKAWTKDAVWAKDVGMVHDVRAPEIPPGTPVHSMVFAR